MCRRRYCYCQKNSMGNCVTVYKNKDPAAMDLSAQIQSPTKENNARRVPSIAELCSRPQSSSMEQETSFRDFSKTEENFFDSIPWLESDCEDFYSVNGDSTSACGDSPNNRKTSMGSSRRHKNQSMDHTDNAVHKQSSTDAKKQLIELFHETSDDDDVNNDPSLKKPAIFNLPEKEKSAETATQCCLPSLVRNMSFGERKKGLSCGAPKLMDGKPDIYFV